MFNRVFTIRLFQCLCCFVLLNRYWGINERSRDFLMSEPREHDYDWKSPTHHLTLTSLRQVIRLGLQNQRKKERKKPSGKSPRASCTSKVILDFHFTCTQCSGAFSGLVGTYESELLAPFEKFRWSWKEEARTVVGITIMKKGLEKTGGNHIGRGACIMATLNTQRTALIDTLIFSAQAWEKI